MKYITILMISLILLFGCCLKKPDLIVEDASIDFSNKTVIVKVKNIGNADAGEHLTYIEINEVGASNVVQSQYVANISQINAGDSWSSGNIRFVDFSSPRDLDLFTLTNANLVVRADAKDLVKESNESNNLFSSDY